jgi:hypothetical protein
MWGTSAITGTVLSATATLTYGALLLWTHHRIVRIAENPGSRQLWSNESYYTNYVHNMYPTAARLLPATPEAPISEDDRVNQQMALLLMKADSRPSPDAHSATFRIDMPEDTEQLERQARSQELVGTPGQMYAGWNRNRADSRPNSLGEHQAWERWQDRGRTTDRPPSIDQRSNHSQGLSREERTRGVGTPGQMHAGWNRDRADSRPNSLGEHQAWERRQDCGRTTDRPPSIDQRSNHSRGLSREERRREIELGHS